MKIKMLVSMAGPSMREPGQIIEVGEEEAARLIAAGFAVPERGEIETATVEPPEKAVLPRGKPRKAR